MQGYRRAALLKSFCSTNPWPSFTVSTLFMRALSNLVNHAAGPANLYQIYLRSFLKTKMQPQIALRNVAVPATHFVHLR